MLLTWTMMSSPVSVTATEPESGAFMGIPVSVTRATSQARRKGPSRLTVGPGSNGEWSCRWESGSLLIQSCYLISNRRTRYESLVRGAHKPGTAVDVDGFVNPLKIYFKKQVAKC